MPRLKIYDAALGDWVYPPGGSGGSQPLEVSRHVTAAEIKTLASSPLQLVAAPGAGKVILPTGGFAIYTAGGTPYTVDSLQDNIQLTTPLGALEVAASLLEISGFGSLLAGSAASDVATWSPNTRSDIASSFDSEWSLSKWENGALVLFYGNNGGSTANPTLGDGTLDILVQYSILDLP